MQCGHKCDRVTPSCPHAGAMIGRRKSVLFIIILGTMLKLPASSFATFPNSLRILLKAHSVALASTLKVLLYCIPPNLRLSTHSIQIPSFWRCNLYQHYFLIDPEILWQETFCCHWPRIPSSFSFSASFRNVFPFALSRKKYSHIPCVNWSLPSILHRLPRCAFHCQNFDGAWPCAVNFSLQQCGNLQ